MREHEPRLQEDAKNLSVVTGSALVAGLITIGLFVNKATATPEEMVVREVQPVVIEVVDRFLAGDMSQAKTFSRGAGALTLFRGEYSLHGVTKIEGNLPRITAIFTYDEKPGRVASDEINITAKVLEELVKRAGE